VEQQAGMQIRDERAFVVMSHLEDYTCPVMAVYLKIVITFAPQACRLPSDSIVSEHQLFSFPY
jgi:hypothetical protein